LHYDGVLTRVAPERRACIGFQQNLPVTQAVFSSTVRPIRHNVCEYTEIRNLVKNRCTEIRKHMCGHRPGDIEALVVVVPQVALWVQPYDTVACVTSKPACG